MDQVPDAAPGRRALRRPRGRGGWGTASPDLRSQQVGQVIYGTIIGLAIVVALQDHPPSAAAMARTLVGTAVGVGLAELYSEAVGIETRTRRRVSRAQLRAIVPDAAGVVVGILFSSLFFILAAAGVLDASAAFTAAKWSGVGLIALYGFAAARLAGAGLGASVLHAAAVGSIGGFLIALKALSH